MKTTRTCKRTLIGITGLVALALLCPAAQADPPDKENLPPGLRKKDKLPPGWEKKAGKRSTTEAASTPAATTTTTTTTTPAPTVPKTPETPAPPTPPSTSASSTTLPKPAETAKVPEAKAPTTSGTAATPIPPPPGKPLTKEQQERQARLDRLLADFEVAAVRPGATDRVLGRLSRITSTPEAILREDWKAQPGVTIGQFYVATLIAKHSRAKSAQVLAERSAGRTWGEVAIARKMPIADLNEAVAEATTAARNATQAAERQAQRAQQTR